MSTKHELIFKNETITLTKCSKGFWLYDHTRGMNLSMGSSSENEAFVEAITYYQKRLMKVECDYKSLVNKVNNFITNVSSEEDIEIF